MERNIYFFYIITYIIIFLINNVVYADLPTCKTCRVTAEGTVDKNVKFGWEDEHSCIVDLVKCKDYINLNTCIGYTIELEYMGSAYGKEYNKTCIIDPIYKNYDICKGCYQVLEEEKYSWGNENNKACLVDLYKCRTQKESNDRSYPYYIIFIDFGFVFLIAWAIIKIL